MLCVGEQNYFNIQVLMEVFGVLKDLFYMIEWKYFQVVVLVVESLNGNVIDFGFFGDFVLFMLVVCGVLVKVVVVLWQSFDGVVIFVLKNLLVCIVVDLQGKIIVVWCGVWSQ